MAATNSFLNGFLGGMQAVNSMIDSQARREYYKDQKLRAEKEWAWKEKEQAQRQELYEQKQQLQNTRAWAYRVSQMDEKQKKQFYEQVVPNLVREQFGNAFDNGNPDETAEFSHFQVKGDQLLPYMRVKDKDGKVIRTGPATQNRTNEAGDPVVGIKMEDMFNAIATDPSLRNLSARAAAETLRLGGELPKPEKVAKGGGSASTEGGLGKTFLNSWETENKKGDVIVNQVYQVGDKFIQRSHNRNAGTIKEAEITPTRAKSLAEQFGGGKATPGADSGKPKPIVNPAPGGKPVVATQNPEVAGAEVAAPPERAHWQQVLGDVTGFDAAKKWWKNLPNDAIKQKAGIDFYQKHHRRPSPEELSGYMASPAYLNAHKTPSGPTHANDLNTIDTEARRIGSSQGDDAMKAYLEKQDPYVVRDLTRRYYQGMQ